MDLATLLLAGLVVLVLWLVWRQLRVERGFGRLLEAPPASLQLLQREVQAMRAGVDERLREQLRQAHELSHRIGQLQKATEHVEQLGTGLEELQKILQPPQLRGAFGERLLEEALAEMLPRDRYRVQYTYPSSGARVYWARGDCYPSTRSFRSRTSAATWSSDNAVEGKPTPR
jgi:hypothetical protein